MRARGVRGRHVRRARALAALLVALAVPAVPTGPAAAAALQLEACPPGTLPSPLPNCIFGTPGTPMALSPSDTQVLEAVPGLHERLLLFDWNLSVGSGAGIPFCSGIFPTPDELPCQHPSELAVRLFDQDSVGGEQPVAWGRYSGDDDLVKYNGNIAGPQRCAESSCSYSLYGNSRHFSPTVALDGNAYLIGHVRWGEVQPDASVTKLFEFKITLFPGSAPPDDVPPTASFTADAQATGSLSWDFDGSASQAVSPATITDYAWDFGDEETASGPSPTVSHPYDTAGTYTVTLIVTDSNGETDVTSQEIEVGPTGLVVNSVADLPNDASAGTNCDTGNTVDGDVPECTLRAAIEAGNEGGTMQPITFDIDVVGTPQITLVDELPEVVAPLAIDGTTQDGDWIELNSPIPTMQPLFLTGADSSVTGFVFRGFDTAVRATGDRVRIRGNRFGTNPGGTSVTTPTRSAIVVGVGNGLAVTDNVIAVSNFGIQAVSGGSGSITGNRIGVDAAGTGELGPSPEIGISLRDQGAWTVSDNVVRHNTFGIIARGASTGPAVIAGNKIGVNANATARLDSSGAGVVVDALPAGATVTNNDVATGGTFGRGIGIAVTGATQCGTDPRRCALQPPGEEEAGTVTSGPVTVSQNRVGAVSGSAAGLGTRGIVVYGGATNVAVTENRVAGHGDEEIVVVGSSDVDVAGNTVGTDAAGSTAVGSGPIGIRVGGANRTHVEGNLVSGRSSAGVVVTEYAPRPTAAVVQAADTSIGDNRIGTNVTGSAAIPNGIGVLVEKASSRTSIVDNLISGNTNRGVEIVQTASETLVSHNNVGTSASGASVVANKLGVLVAGDAAKTTIGDNVVGGSAEGGIVLTTSDYTAVVNNWVGVARSGTQALPNSVGISVTGSAGIVNNRVRFNTGRGIDITAGSHGFLSRNSTFANGSEGINAPAPPAPPGLEVVNATFAGGEKRTWFVVDTQGDAAIELFANPNCSDPDEGRDPIAFTKVAVNPAGTQAVITVDEPLPAGARYTATQTTFTGEVSSLGTPIANTSEYSNCAAPQSYVDSSGTGIPDVIQNALGGDPADAGSVVFPGDGGGAIRLTTSAGTFAKVRPVTPPDGAESVSFPAGLFAFEVVGITPGASVVVNASTSQAASAYYRHGPTFVGGAAHWYDWVYNPATGLGARPLDENGASRNWQLHFTDGLAGDDDFAANGTIVDPGGPGSGTLVDPVSALPATLVTPRFTG